MKLLRHQDYCPHPSNLAIWISPVTQSWMESRPEKEVCGGRRVHSIRTTESSAVCSNREAARDEAGQIKNETEQIRDDTQAIRDETGQIKSETEAIRDEAQQIKDSTEITPYIDSSEESGHRAGFQRADINQCFIPGFRVCN